MSSERPELIEDSCFRSVPGVPSMAQTGDGDAFSLPLTVPRFIGLVRLPSGNNCGFAGTLQAQNVLLDAIPKVTGTRPTSSPDIHIPSDDLAEKNFELKRLLTERTKRGSWELEISY